MDQSLTLEEELVKVMKRRKYYLTTLCHRSIKSTTNGFVGFQITKGVWYKLVVFLMEKIGDNITSQEVHLEEFNEKEVAFSEMHKIEQKY